MRTVQVVVPDHNRYYPGHRELHIRLTGDDRDGRLLGARILGDYRAAVAKRIDVVATALHVEPRVHDLCRACCTEAVRPARATVGPTSDGTLRLSRRRWTREAVDTKTGLGPERPLDVLIVGAGPTGLLLAAQLQTFGVSFRLIDKGMDRARESRALAVQARTLEVLQNLGLADRLVARGNASAQLSLHLEGRTVAPIQLGQFAASDTRFPFILFVSQAETEALLEEHLRRSGASVERRVELITARREESGVDCVLRHDGEREETLRARYVVGCDGAHSTVRKQAGIAFEGDAYLQDFMLGDVDADGFVEPDTLHSFAANGNVAMFFPLRSPATWRVIAMGGQSRVEHERAGQEEALVRGDLLLPEIQAVVDRATLNTVRLRDPIWLTHFRLHHRQAAAYRRGRVFLAGDAAHIHSPVGGQGMNTGMQDAWNLGWKLALVIQGHAAEPLLDTYEAERWPVGRFLLRYTDRLFGMFTRVMSRGAVAAWFRRNVVARVLPWVFRSPRLRRRVFSFVSELDIQYRRGPGVFDLGAGARSAVRAGDRLPDGEVTRNGERRFLQQEIRGPRFHLLLCGPTDVWDPAQVRELADRHAGLLAIERLTREDCPEVLVDRSGGLLARLGARATRQAIQQLVRPDGYIGARVAGHDLSRMAGLVARCCGRRA